ncbi:hypothetical protein Tco_1040342 [Tanacetum coccineum]
MSVIYITKINPFISKWVEHDMFILYQKGLALVEVVSFKGKMAALATNLGAKVVDKPNGHSFADSMGGADLFEGTFNELQKWADAKSSKYTIAYYESCHIRNKHNIIRPFFST